MFGSKKTKPYRTDQKLNRVTDFYLEGQVSGLYMSYIPPHKRHSKDPVIPSPVPDSLLTKSKKSVDFSSSSDRCNRVTFAENFISKWFLIGPNGIGDELPSSVKLVPVSLDSVECRNGERPLVLMNDDDDFQKANVITEESEEEERARWMLLVAEKVEDDLVLAYERAKTAMEVNQHVLRLVARLGKVFLYRRQAGSVAEFSRKNLKKMFSTDVSTSNLQHIKSKVVPRHKFSIDLEKETYTVKVSHNTRPTETINCKCTLKEDGRLSMYKASLMHAELNVVWHLVFDVSCIDKSLDMRLMLAAKRKMTALTEKEISDIKELLDSATVDPNVKGGLRWPLGKSSSRDGYRVFEVCHVRATIYKNRTLRLRIRETDRFNERTGTGAVKKEVTLILKNLNTKLQYYNVLKTDEFTEKARESIGVDFFFPKNFLADDEKHSSLSFMFKLETEPMSHRSEMSYIPPKDLVRPSPVPDSLLTEAKKNIEFRSSSDDYNRITFSENFISKWFIVGPNGIKDEYPPPVKFVPASPLVLMMNNDFQKARKEEEIARWLLIAEKVEEDLLLAYERAKTATMEENQHVLRLVVRFGKILFYGRQAGPVAESSRRNLKKMFSTDVPAFKLQHIKSKVVPSHGFSIDLEKETYTVKIRHNTLPNATIICKCALKEDGRLSMYKASLFLTSLLCCMFEKEISDIKELLDSATVDPTVKGGLRWPLGKSSSGDEYIIFEVCHVRATIYKNQTLRLRVRETVRSYERTVTGPVKRDVTLILKGINSKLQEKNIERDSVLEMLRDALGTIWDFMHCDASLT
ncbi:unnamed protein product [Thlaspi arvense]|uniref:DUF7903 domain-containing protein n=1 Tax=Thlaspi arvense TaxID=13288 RepID=A0AAU9SB39_THLAR|nr:unnamed protein product [Thlaspi arvense]